ncbi:MAG: preprotein translocase subunit SecG [Anderseniella sp.]
MIAVITVVHLLIVMALIVTVLMQRSEGGALGIGGGGGGGGGGMFTSRGAGSALTRTTAFLAICFFVTSLSLAYLSRGDSGGSSVLDQVAPSQSQGEEGGGRSVLPTLPGTPPAPTEPAVPTQ